MTSFRWFAILFCWLLLVPLQAQSICLADDSPSAADAGGGEADVPYGVGDWPESLGNHRAVVQVEKKADAVWVHLPWRRRDESPEKKEIVIIDGASNQRVKNCLRVRIDAESGDLLFQPPSATGVYYVYYMPFRTEGEWYFPRTVYLPPTDTADAVWKTACEPLVRQIKSGKTGGLPRAKVVQFQAINEFHRFDPMEVPATAAEMQKLLAEHRGKPYLVFPEDRRRPIRMNDALPLGWIRSGPRDSFHGEAYRGEYYVFQLGVYAVTQDVIDIRCGMKPFQNATAGGGLGELTCFNTGGKDWLGRPFVKRVSVGRGRVQPLWFGVQVPCDATAGEYRTMIALQPQGLAPAEIAVALTVNDRVLDDAGDRDLWRYSRLRWLNSTIGLDDEAYPPYVPITISDRTLHLLGRSLRFDATGLPASIQSTFGRSLDRVDAAPQEILAGPIRFVVETPDGTKEFAGGDPRIIDQKSGAVTWESTSRAGPFALHCRAKLECDGYVNFRLTLSGKNLQEAAALKDIRLEIPLRREIATYMMGLGRKGGYRPAKWDWKWDVRYANNHFWIGDVNAGLGGKFKHVEDRWDYFNLRASGVYEDWGNAGLGGCRLREVSPDLVVLSPFTGPKKLKAGAELHFNFGLAVTPFHRIDPVHWNWRYQHPLPWNPFPTIDEVVRNGARILTVHQGANGKNPYINYPFVVVEPMKQLAKEAHAHNIKLKIYYTIRELSNYTAEIWALRSLGDEVYVNGPGFHLADQFDSAKGENKPVDPNKPTGSSWLIEHLRSDYVPAWHQPLGNGHCDAAIATQGLSRWHNYYLEGLAWLIREVGVDGLYLDGAGFDREIMKRIRKVMDRTKPGCLIDFHEGNSFAAEYGMNNPASCHLELLPYINSLWFGEGFNYNESPDYWLVEMSGIPYGLTGEMLQDGGNRWRGMIYGMTTRLGWSGDPRPIWKCWDDFGIDKARMIGYWDPSCPVKTGRHDVLATAYVRQGKTLVLGGELGPEARIDQAQDRLEGIGARSDEGNMHGSRDQGFPAGGEVLSVRRNPRRAGPRLAADLAGRSQRSLIFRAARRRQSICIAAAESRCAQPDYAPQVQEVARRQHGVAQG